VSRLALVKPEQARGGENMILAAAQRGALGEKVGIVI
jgi:DNA-binding TFAR19-related protein (PDSD5 family)